MLKIAEVWRWRKLPKHWWQELPKHWWRENPKMAEHWWKFPKRCCWELPWMRIPEVVTDIAERLPAVTEMPEAVDLGISNGPTS